MKIDQSLFSITKVKYATYAGFIKSNHYAKGCNQAGTAYGLIYKEKYIVGTCVFATPISEEVRAWPFGSEHVDRVTELHRLALLDKVKWKQRPDFILSWFIARCLKMILNDKPDIRGILSFSDITEGHTGAIYRALNALYFGTTGRKRKYYLDKEGRLMSARNNGRNIKIEEAQAKGLQEVTRQEKHKYMWVVGPSVKERKIWRNNLLHQPVSWKEELP